MFPFWTLSINRGQGLLEATHLMLEEGEVHPEQIASLLQSHSHTHALLTLKY